MTLNDIEEDSLRSIAVLGSNMNRQITVGNVTQPKAVLITVKIFAVKVSTPQYIHTSTTNSNLANQTSNAVFWAIRPEANAYSMGEPREKLSQY